ncbi:uncharacterized protein LOC130690176 isoform X2 [Daphnia carinata]|uniref:uncharacterized protein LOC130690176 isoform X2 n=1 Tax=Daphnia carinata TaxID=120202 RepID=UPI00286867AF|nr:uncharacterized protein LOC130690176 isoform X2 [Daphnia carinata]
MCYTCLVILICIAVVSSLESPKNSSSKRWSVRRTNCELKNNLKSWAKSFKNDSLSILSRATKKTNPMGFIRKQLETSKKYNPADPLHAYPNKWDLMVHSLFQKLSRFEVNNADAIRKVIRVVRILTIIGLVVGTLGIVLGVALPLSPLALAFGRREDEVEDKNDVVDWNYVDQISQSVIYAIENGMLKYEM